MKFDVYLRSVIKAKEERAEELKREIKAAATADEVRALGDTLQTVLEELKDAEEQLNELEKQTNGGEGAGEDTGEGAEGENRSGGVAGLEVRGGKPVGSYTVSNGAKETNTDPYATKEYRMAFKDYVQRGSQIPEDLIKRDGGDPGTTLAAELGAIIPTTIMNEFIKNVSKVRGNIYNKVRKLNVKGGVKIPVSNLKASFKWISETTVSERQKAGEVKEFIEFSYNIGEIRVSTSLLASIVTLEQFETEVVSVMMEAYLEAMDKGIVSGTGEGQLLGIANDPRVKNVIELTESDISDWTAWRKKLFANVPLSKRGRGEFMFTPNTVETYLMTMKDENNRPLWKDPDNAMSENGTFAGKFFGKHTEYVEPDVLTDFITAEDGDLIGVYWVPSDYAINSNMAFGMKRYYDEEKNEWVNKGLTIVDGKMIDVSGCYLIKKKVSA